MGGKIRQGPAIAKVLTGLAKPGAHYYEPFCGGMGSAMATVPAMVAANAGRIALSDISKPLITTWRALVFDDWQPPRRISEAMYNRVKNARDPNDPLTAYIGFGMSFGGKWFGGYARDRKGVRDFAAELAMSLRAKTSTLRKANALRAVPTLSIDRLDYGQVQPSGALMYLDPPYVNRTKAHSHDGEFDTDAFWKYARERSRSNIVIVTAFEAPRGWRAIHSWGDTVVRHHSGNGSDGTDERIFRHLSQL